MGKQATNISPWNDLYISNVRKRGNIKFIIYICNLYANNQDILKFQTYTDILYHSSIVELYNILHTDGGVSIFSCYCKICLFVAGGHVVCIQFSCNFPH